MLSVGQLRQLLAGRPADEPFLVHAGWDFPVLSEDAGPDDEGFVVFLDFEDSAVMVNKDWYEKVKDA